MGVRKPDGDIVGNVVAAQRKDRGIPDAAVGKDGDVAGAAADVDEGHPDLRLFGVRVASAEASWPEDQIVDGEAGQIAAFHDVLGGGDGAGDDMDLHLQPHAAHADGVFYPVLIIHDILLGDDVEKVPVGRDGHRLCRIDGPGDVVLPYLLVLDRHDAVAVEALDVGARDAGQAAGDLDARHQLRFFQPPS